MVGLIPETHLDLLEDDKKAFGFLATVMPDGTPQVTPVWFDTEGDTIRINTARGRVKDSNMRARPPIALAIMDPEDPYRYIQLRGAVQTGTEKGAREHIDKLAGKYLGTSEYPWYGGETRVIYKLHPEKASAMG